MRPGRSISMALHDSVRAAIDQSEQRLFDLEVHRTELMLKKMALAECIQFLCDAKRSPAALPSPGTLDLALPRARERDPSETPARGSGIRTTGYFPSVHI